MSSVQCAVSPEYVPRQESPKHRCSPYREGPGQCERPDCAKLGPLGSCYRGAFDPLGPLCEAGKLPCACGKNRVGEPEEVYDAAGGHRRLWCSPVRIEDEWVDSPDEWYRAEVERMKERAPA